VYVSEVAGGGVGGFTFRFGLSVVAGVSIGEGNWFRGAGEDAESFEAVVFFGEVDIFGGGECGGRGREVEAGG